MKIAVLDDYQGAAERFADWQPLQEQAEVRFFTTPLLTEQERIAALADYDIIAAMRERTPFPAQLLQKLPNLKLLVTTGMRNAAIDLVAATSVGITVCGTAGVGHGTAELTWGLVLALARQLRTESNAMSAGGWQSTIGKDLHGATLGIIGLGKLGLQVARFGQAFGMTVLAWSPNLTPERAQEADVRAVSKQALLQKSDFISIHMVLSARSRNLITAADFAEMKTSAYLINTSRGPIVNETDLLAALQSGQIAGAALDVYDQEPLPADHALRQQHNLLMTPHIGYVTEQTYSVFYGETVEAIEAYLAGRPIRVLNSS